MESDYRIILASASPRRRELMEQIGLEFEVCPGSGEEETKGSEPWEQVEELSFHKAMEAARNMDEDTLVIGADTLVFYWNAGLGKPKDKKEAAAMLQTLQGNTHQVYTGVTLVWKEDGVLMHKSFHERTDVTICPMSADEIDEYVSTGDPMDKAGAYGIQGIFARYVQGICGDYNNVVGLPVGRLYQEMKREGFL